MENNRKTYLANLKWWNPVCQQWIEIERLFEASNSVIVREFCHKIGWCVNCLIELTPQELNKHLGLKMLKL